MSAHPAAQRTSPAEDTTTAERPATIQRMYDDALERASVDGSPATPRYLSVLLAAS